MVDRNGRAKAQKMEGPVGLTQGKQSEGGKAGRLRVGEGEEPAGWASQRAAAPRGVRVGGAQVTNTPRKDE